MQSSDPQRRAPNAAMDKKLGTATTDPIKRFSGTFNWLSNFYYTPVTLDGVLYPSVEHAYQAAKTLDLDAREKIRCLVAPAAAKSDGRKLLLREGWDEMKLNIMLDLLRQKFTHPGLRAKLVATGTRQLIEGNFWGDTFWGVDSRVGGENHLGRLLMQVRGEIRGESRQAR